MRTRRAHGRDAAVVGLALRFALRAPQGCAAGTANEIDKNKNQKKKGTLLMRKEKGHF
jgi:hypothetical protein